MKQKLLNLSLLLFCLMAGVSSALAKDLTKSFEWTASDTYTVSDNSFTANDVTWTFSVSDDKGANGGYIPTGGSKSSNEYGLKFGNSGSAYYGTVTFTTNFFNNVNVKSVTMKVKNNGSKVGTLTAKQGTTTIGTAKSPSDANWNTLTALGTTGNKGALTVTYQVAQASYVQSITVTYEQPSTPTVAYTVTFDANTNGTCATSSLTEASAGAGVKLPNVTANTGYAFNGWATTSSATSANAGKANDTYNPSTNITLYAVYSKLYTISIETPENGTLEVKNGENVVNNGDQVAEGTTLNITATPNRGYAFRNWQAEDGSTHTYTKAFTYENVASDVTIKANFDEIAKYTVTLADDNTELTPEYGGEPVALPSRSAIGDYTFAGWSETNVEEETTTTPTIIAAGDFEATANVTLYPIYKRSEDGGSTDVPVTLKIADKENGTANGTQRSSYTIDTNVTATSTGGTSNSGKVYGDGTQWRFYRSDSGEMTISTTSGTLKSVTVTYSVDKNGVMLHGTDEIASGTAVENINDTSIAFTAGGGEPGKTNGVIRVTDIAVVYTVEGQTTYYCSSPTTSELLTITLNPACTDGDFVYSTFSSSKPFYVSEDIVVSEIGVIDGELVVESYKTGDIVPANTGVMISAQKGGNYYVEVADAEMEELAKSVLGEDNCLRSSGDSGITATDMSKADTEFFRLTMHNGETIGFFWGAVDGAAFDLGANKAYLAVATDNLGLNAGSAKRLWITNETDGINNVSTNVENNVIYNLNGQRVSNATKGLYIKNGQKYFVK